MAAALFGCGALAVILLVNDRRDAMAPVTELRRNPYGEGSISRSLRVVIDGREEEEELEVTLQERKYRKEELEALFDRASGKLEILMLGENESLDAVYEDLNLITVIPGEPVEVAWEIDRYDLMTVYGELNEENLKDEKDGVLVSLRAYLTYTEDADAQILREMTARVFPRRLTGAKARLAKVSEAIGATEEESREDETVKLPTRVNGKEVALYNPRELRGWYVLLLGPLLCLLLFALQRQNEQKEKEAREQQMMLDYPEIMNKLALLIGAGMTVKNAWQKIVQDYEALKELRGERYAYEEMAMTLRQMQSGMTEIESYERFGRRCGLKAYRKLSALLGQNLRKGTRGLTELLGAEAVQAFEERKASAKRRGEEAGTKLLAPMFFMLGMVLVIVIVPAFLSIRM